MTPLNCNYLKAQFFCQFVDQNAWIKENYPKDKRYESVIVYTTNGTNGNVLTAASIQYVISLNIFHINIVN